MFDFLCKKSEIRNYLENFPKNYWYKAIECAVVYGVRMFHAHNVPLNLDSIEKLHSTYSNDISKTLANMKKELLDLSTAIKRVEAKTQRDIEENNKDYLKENQQSTKKNHYEKTRNSSTKDLHKPTVNFKDRSYTPTYLKFSRVLKEPNVCPITEAHKYTKFVKIRNSEDLDMPKITGEFLRTRASLSTQPTSPQFISMMSSPREFSNYHY